MEENFFVKFESFLVTLNVCPGFDWFGKCLSNTDLIFLVNITSAGIMADGAFLLGVTL